MSPRYVLGTHVSHHGSACLLRDGRIAVAIEKERVTRRKHDGHHDDAAIRYCLDAEGITIDDVDLVVQNANFHRFDGLARDLPEPRLAARAREVRSISHHLAHAYSAFAASPFDDTAVLVVDGCGNSFVDCMDLCETTQVPDRHLLEGSDLAEVFYEKDSYYLREGKSLRAVYKDFSPWRSMKNFSMHPGSTMHSIGGAYLGVSMYVFRGMEDPGKLMGLAPYGRKGQFQFEMFDLSGGRVRLRYDWMKEFDRPARSYQDFVANFQYYADIAHRCQREIERALLYLVESRYEAAPSASLCMAGGVFLNAVANTRILRESRFRNVFIQPAAHDAGLSIGCAYYGWLATMGEKLVRHSGTPYLGRDYGPSRAQRAAEKAGLSFTCDDDYIAATARLLAQGKTVAWYQGGSEFGPRALGHRSILADPRHASVRDHINRRIKLREDFRPFAPSVPLDEVTVYFDHAYESPYMILVGFVRPEWRDRIPAVVHADDSCRVQTVTADVSPEYYRLLKEFGKLTGYSVLLNTSLNRRGQPIVETPEEAVELFLETALDVLVFPGGHSLRPEFARAAAATPFSPDAIRQALGAAIAAGRGDELRRLGGCIDVGVQGTSYFSFDLGSAALADGRSSNPDFTVVFHGDGLSRLVDDPLSVHALYEGGAFVIQGLSAMWGGDQIEAVHERLVRLAQVARRELAADRAG